MIIPIDLSSPPAVMALILAAVLIVFAIKAAG